MSQRLGDLLVKEKVITPEQLAQATKVQKETNCRLGSALVKLGFLTDEDVTNFLSRQYGVPAINLSYFEIDPAVVKLIPFETAKRYQILPLSRVGASLTIAMVDPTNVFAMDDIKFMTGFNIEPVVASESSITEGIEKAYGTAKEEDLEQVMQSMTELGDADVELQTEEQEMDLNELEKAADEAPIVKLVNLVLTDAVKRGASDIHMEPYEKEFRVRFRIDGILQSIMSPPLKLKDAITSRLKIMAKLDISEKRLPQDGRIMLKMAVGGKKKQLDFRVSTLPTLVGRKDRDAVARQGEPAARHDQARLRAGIAGQVRESDSEALRHGAGHRAHRVRQDQHAVFLDCAAEPARHQHHDRRRSGRVPVAGRQPGADEGADRPELRGRAARLPAAGSEHHPGRRDSRLRNRRNRHQGRPHRPPGAFHAAHQRRAGNHHPPDEHGHRAIPGGDLRAPDLRAAPGAPHLQGLHGGRSTCPHQTLIEEGYTPEEAKTVKIQKGKGCGVCNNTGYKGRTGLYEVMEVDDEIRELVLVGASAVELKKKAIERGMITLRRSGLIKVGLGMTTLEEVARETIH